MRPLLDASAYLSNPTKLRAQAESEGYLYLPGLLPRDKVMEVRDAFAGILGTAGWLEDGQGPGGTRPRPGVFAVEPEPAFMAVFNQQFSVLGLHELQHHPRLLEVMGHLLEAAVLVHPRSILRNIFPSQDAYTTPAHQDYVHFQGTQRCYAAWIPLTDCSAEMGGLAVAAASHGGGIYDIRPALGAGALEVVPAFEGQWRYSPTRMGDVVIHHCMGVHRGVPNRSESIRLSVDARYQPRSEPVCEDALYPHRQFAAWDEIDAHWPPTPLRRYWEAFDLKVVPFDFAHYEKRDRLAFEMAENGDQNALSVLQRIHASDPDPEKRARAGHALTQLSNA